MVRHAPRWSSFVLSLGVMGGLLAPVSRADAAVSAFVLTSQLRVAGDGLANAITVRVVAGDPTRLEVLDGGTVVGQFLRSNFTSIIVEGFVGADTIVLSGVNGEIIEPAILSGGSGNDTMTGGAANDTFLGGPDNDRLIWNPGDGSDLMDGEAGTDTVEVNGSSDAETFTVAANGVRVIVTRNVGSVSLDIGTAESLVLNTREGDDIVTCTGNLAALILLVVDGGSGNDNLTGSNGPDVILGGEGHDSITGSQSNDTIFAGAGDDVMFWNPGHANDTLEGQAGADKLFFTGSNASEMFSILPNGGRVLMFRDVAAVTMDMNDVETVEVLALGGTDTFTTAASLAGTDVTRLILDGGDLNDTINGSDTNDILRGGAGVDVINGGGGNDEITPGPGNEMTVTGGTGDDTFFWNDNDGNDIVEGQTGADRLVFTGSPLTEDILVSLSGGRVLVQRTLNAVTLDFGQLEALDVATGTGDDSFIVGPNLGALALSVDLGAGDDTLLAIASNTVTANGGPGLDTLNFDALNQLVSTTPTTITAAGVARVTHVNFEQFNVLSSPNQPPTISIAAPTTDPAATATTPFIQLAGTAADATGIASVTWINNRGGSGPTNGTAAWSVPNLTVFPGVNVITVTVVDTVGQQATDILTVTVNTLTYTMAEGATGGFFDTDILLANPNSVVAPVTITYLKGDGTTVTQNLDLPATSRTTIAVETIAGLESAEVSSTVTSTSALPLVVERTMRWDATGYGAHTERATDAPTTTWYFAEGSQGFFQTYVLLANPGTVSNDATITFLPESGAPVVKPFTLAPTSRQTIDASTIPELANSSFGIVVSFSQPGVAERAMYFNAPGTPTFNAGHESAGVNAPSTSWFLAEGATGSFFTTFVLLANPGTSDATATVTFLPATGLPVTKTHVVQAGRRLTLNVATEDASLADSAVATQVVSTQPILVERAQYWPFTPNQWYEAHNSFGGTALGAKWGLAEGRVGGAQAYQTYILLANANTTRAAEVTVTFLRENGTTVAKNYTVPPTSRFNVHVNSMVPELVNESFGAVVQVTSGPGIFVERALYSDTAGAPFAAGTNALATRLP